MDNFWVKVVIAVIVIVALVLGIKYYKAHKTKQPAKPERTVGDAWREDEQRLRAEPNIAPQAAAGEQPQIQFKELTEEEQAGAEQLFEMAITSRKMARLPGMSFGQMVNYCRQIIEKYPGSEFDYKARRMLAEVPQNEWERYKITQQEIDGFQK
jgi:hypothetical protein